MVIYPIPYSVLGRYRLCIEEYRSLIVVSLQLPSSVFHRVFIKHITAFIWGMEVHALLCPKQNKGSTVLGTHRGKIEKTAEVPFVFRGKVVLSSSVQR